LIRIRGGLAIWILYAATFMDYKQLGNPNNRYYHDKNCYYPSSNYTRAKMTQALCCISPIYSFKLLRRGRGGAQVVAPVV